MFFFVIVALMTPGLDPQLNPNKAPVQIGHEANQSAPAAGSTRSNLDCIWFCVLPVPCCRTVENTVLLCTGCARWAHKNRCALQPHNRKIADLYHQVAGKKLWSSRNDLTNKQHGRLA